MVYPVVSEVSGVCVKLISRLFFHTKWPPIPTTMSKIMTIIHGLNED